MWCYLCSVWANLCLSCIWVYISLKLLSEIALPETKEVRHFLPSVQFGRALCFSNQISEGKKCKATVWKQTKKKSRKTKTDGRWWVKNQERSWVLRALWVKCQKWTCVAGNLRFIFSDVMWLKETGTKKKRNHNKGVAGDFLVSSLCMFMFGTQPSRAQAHFTISFMTSN